MMRKFQMEKAAVSPSCPAYHGNVRVNVWDGITLLRSSFVDGNHDHMISRKPDARISWAVTTTRVRCIRFSLGRIYVCSLNLKNEAEAAARSTVKTEDFHRLSIRRWNPLVGGLSAKNCCMIF